ncbi:hypothetical protein BGX23_007276 [Mortierella sp. AD031]|nr:hypothetical protein BGX23_007276 [Mortierella sp. AD031]KAG0203452.1 hypothetical protein BGX33_009119 [Mortierella sp. NVP41]
MQTSCGSNIERQNVRRKTVLKQLTTSLGPAWKPDPNTSTATAMKTTTITTATTHRHDSAGPPPKRLRKTVELFNPSAFPLSRKRSSTSSTLSPETRRGPGRPLGSGKRGMRGRGGRGRGRESRGRGRGNGVSRHTSTSTSTRPTHRRHSSTTTTVSSTTGTASQQQRSRRERREDQKLNDAAHASRLHAHGLCVEEFELFQFHIARSDLESYLKVRNTMLWLWRETPDEPLTLTRAFEETKNFGLHHGLIAHVYEFLLRSGYINFGGCVFHDDEEKEEGQGIKTNGRQDSIHHRPATTSGPSNPPKTIVVIGSGIAGVGTARQLENLFQYYAWKFAPDLPPKVVVLEARSRVGGRMHSFELNTKPSSSSSPDTNETKHEPNDQHGQTIKAKAARHCVDLGAQIITGFENGNPMEIIVRRQLKDLQLHYLVEETCDLYGHDGKLVSKSMDVHCEVVFNQILEQACQLRDEDHIPRALEAYLGDRIKTGGRGPGRVNSTDLPTLGHSMDYFMETHPEFKSWTSQELGLIHWHYANLEFANATPLDQLSLRHWDQDDDYEFSGHHCMVKEGYGQVPVRLSQGLDVRLNQPVSLIERSTKPSGNTLHNHIHRDQHQEAIHIQCRDGTSYKCSAAVVTVPLGVLKSHQIQFSPQLPDWKKQAINNLGFGLLNKLVLVFEKPFWDASIELFGYVGSGQEGSSGKGYDLKAYRSSRGKFYMYWNCIVVSGLPVLVTLMAGQSAYDCENMSKEELVQEALDSLALIHPEIEHIPAPVETIVTRWSQDEFAQGSYSFVGQKGTGDDYDRLAKAVDGQLYFAGEATSRQYPATAHGAYLSGLRVAKEILDSLIGPQVVLSSRQAADSRAQVKDDDEEVEELSESVENGGGRGSQDASSNSSERSHLMSMEDAHTTDSPPPDSKTAPSLLMSLGHGFVIPRRRGRVSRSLIAKFVAERSDDDSESEDEVKVEEDSDEGSEQDSEEEEDSESEDENDDSESEEETEEIVVRKADRTSLWSAKPRAKAPRKASKIFQEQTAPLVPKRGRGRPRKIQLSAAAAPVKTLALGPSGSGSGSSSRKDMGTATATKTMTTTSTTSTTTATTTTRGVFKRRLSMGSTEVGRPAGGKSGSMRQTRARYEAHYLGSF